MDHIKCKAKENSSLKSNKPKTARNPTPIKNTKKQPSKDFLSNKEISVQLQVKEEAMKKRKSTPKIRLFSRKHIINNKKEVTEICDMTTGASTYSSKTSAKGKCTYTMGQFNQILPIGSQLVNVSPFASNTHYMKTEWKELTPKKCNCRKINKTNMCSCHSSQNNDAIKSTPLSKTEELKVRYDDCQVFSKKEFRNFTIFTAQKQEETAGDSSKCPYNLCPPKNCPFSKGTSLN